MTSTPARLRIVGTSGSGKTTLARRIAAARGSAHLELDAVFWSAHWQRRDLDEALTIVREFADAHPEGWVIDGNWNTPLQGLLDPGTPGGADVIVWLDLSRPVVMRRVIARTVRRGLLREELWHGNRERVSSWLRWHPERNIMRWAWTSHPRNREKMLARIAAGDPVVRLRSQREADAWLTAFTERGRTVER